MDRDGEVRQGEEDGREGKGKGKGGESEIFGGAWWRWWGGGAEACHDLLRAS